VTKFTHYSGGSSTGNTETLAVTGKAEVATYLNALNNQGVAEQHAAAHIQGFALTTNVLSGAQYKTLHDTFVVLNAALGR